GAGLERLPREGLGALCEPRESGGAGAGRLPHRAPWRRLGGGGAGHGGGGPGAGERGPGRGRHRHRGTDGRHARQAGRARVHRLQETVRDVRWVRGEGVHLTLRFLGWTKAETLALLEAPLRAAAARCPPAAMAARGLGTFPERGSPRVLWLGLGVPPAVLALQ